MPFSAQHLPQAPMREAVDQLQGSAVLEFGTPWCTHCQRAQPFIEQALGTQGDVQHIKVEDGPGQPLGRSYRVKLWPTLVFLRNGAEVARVVRPQTVHDVQQAMSALKAGA